MNIDYSKAPRHETAYRRYVEEGGHVGDFLTAVLENDLTKAVGRADGTNEDLLAEHVKFVYNELPADCWGSPEKVEAWHEHDGMKGRPEP